MHGQNYINTVFTVAAFEAVTCNYGECDQFRLQVSSGRHNSLIQPNMSA